MKPKPEKMYQKHKIYQMVIECPKCPKNITDGHKIYQLLSI
jgi:hypothetical protein